MYGAPMPRKPKTPPDDPAQSKRFIDMAREVGAEKASPDFERLFRKVAEQPKGAPSKVVGESGASSVRRSRKRKDPSSQKGAQPLAKKPSVKRNHFTQRS